MSRFALEIDRDLCTGYGVCVLDAPEAFELDGDGIAVATIAATDDPAVLEAARACPMGAIRIVALAPGRAAA